MHPVVVLFVAGRRSAATTAKRAARSEVVRVDVHARRGDDEELPEVHQLAVHVFDVACEARRELVEVAFDGEKEDVAAGDGLDPLLRWGRPVEDAEDHVALGVVLVEVFFGRLQVEIEIAHTRPVVERREKGSVGA